MSDAHADREQDLFERIAQIVDAARTQVARSVNTAMVHAYWHIGQEIVEVEQHGAERADYGAGLMERLSKRLTERFGRGFGVATVRRCRQFYLTWPGGSAITGEAGVRQVSLGEPSAARIRSAARIEFESGRASLFPPLLGWTHYRILMRVENEHARAFYEIEAARESWSVRELERQIASLLFERLAKSRDKDGVLALAREGQTVESASDVIKDPFVLEFLDLDERPRWQEHDLEQALIDRLEHFLLELGRGFCFVARQKRVTLEGDHFYVDLVFYNRLLRSFVLIDLKLGKLTHQDLGQMQMYTHYFDRFEREDWESPTIGIVLCSEKNDAMVRITLPEDSQILASRYQLVLPSEDELRAELERERQDAERALSLATERDSSEDG